MKNLKLILFYILPFLVFATCCNPDPDPTPKITITQATEIHETGFTVHWNVEDATLADFTIELCCAPDFDVITKAVSVNDPGQTSQTLNGLKGATKYYCRAVGNLSDGNSILSNVMTIQTSYQSSTAWTDTGFMPWPKYLNRPLREALPLISAVPL